VAIPTEQLGRVVIAEELDRRGIDEREIALVVDDVEAVRGVLSDPDRDRDAR
jgi:hypothetical protein